MVSIKGLVTVNALSANTTLIKEFDQIQSKNCVAYYLKCLAYFVCGFATDCLCILFLTLVLFCVYFFSFETTASNIGLIIFQIISLITIFQITIKLFFEAHTSSISLSRVYEYTQVPPEEDIAFFKTSSTWPSKGHIKFNNICLQYTFNGPLILKNITLDINSTEKIGIIGRTGSGKSSLISTLFRLYDFTGNLTIDGVDIKQISLQDLRANLTIIPQNPILFSGSLRKNLDPFNQYTDEEIWNVLDEVNLKHSISSLPKQLENYVQENGNNFSNGERQLLCLARAILRNCKILVLDEVTSNIDLETDQLIQKTIRNKFVDSTLLTIAHRLYTVIDSDRILILSDGKVVEFDHPYQLLKQPDGYLYNQVLQNGKDVMEELTKVAEMHYMKTCQLK